MSSIFEELMGVNSTLTESVRPSRKSKVVENKKIPVSRLKVESRRVFEEKDYDDLANEFSTEENEENPDEVVLVIDPELPSDQEVPDDAAEEMIGDLVYKCPICGSNYVCDCDATMGEGIEVDENGVPTECPICGDDADQILVGEIAPSEGAGEESDPELLDNEDEDELPDNEEEEDFEEPSEDLEDDEPEIEESLKEDLEDDEPALELSVPECEPKSPAVEISNSKVELVLDDKKFENLMTQIIRENYKGSPMFKITRCSTKNGKLKVEYFVREGRKVTKGVLVGEGFDKKSRKMTIKFADKGAFTESFTKTPSFVIECVRVRNAVIPTSVNYNYKVRVNESLYRVSGKVGK